ncbi:MAG: hypothetical protein IJS27_01485 [Ruminococcus sp.]|nr:hypothetical protein [Ruminococcus sp.]MBQ9515686.1 hypothetical protein [Ruminococcus sp.]
MASSSFTSHLGLCNWAATDRPKRADFVSDNNIIDNTVGTHIADTTKHLTAAEKEKALTPYTAMIYAGTGADNRAVTTAFQPKFVIVYKKNAPLIGNENGTSIINSAATVYAHGGSAGVSLTSTGFTVRQQATAENGMRYSLNEEGEQYCAVVFR